MSKPIKQRAFLKWAGGKYTLAEAIRAHLPAGDLLVEPFVGAGSVFLNTDYPRYLLNDINADLISLYQILQRTPDFYIREAAHYFTERYNDKETYLALRLQFNQSRDPMERALLFLYLNRHGFNGLCRYNKSGLYNVPFGKYKKPYFPQAELAFFAEKSQKAQFVCMGYQQLFDSLSAKAAVVYCDPPYVALSKTASFTAYTKGSFTLDDQALLAQQAEAAQAAGHTVVISNHDTPWTRRIYAGAVLDSVQVGRSISQKGSSRGKVAELFAIYRASSTVTEPAV